MEKWIIFLIVGSRCTVGFCAKITSKFKFNYQNLNICQFQKFISFWFELTRVHPIPSPLNHNQNPLNKILSKKKTFLAWKNEFKGLQNNEHWGHQNFNENQKKKKF